jgi:hypothetical protein
MTNNETLKKEAEDLLSKIKSFRTNFVNQGRSRDANHWDNVERDLRLMLFVARTDEENEQQYKRDCQC